VTSDQELSPDAQDEPGYPKRLVVWAGRLKAWLQMLIGVYALGWLAWAFLLSHHTRSCVPINNSNHNQFCYAIPPQALTFHVMADALASATVIQLAYTLFTPGPDEALDPVLLAIATALLFQLGQVDSFHWQDGLTLLLYGVTLGGLFVVRVFIAPDEDKPPKLWWWTQQSVRHHPRPEAHHAGTTDQARTNDPRTNETADPDLQRIPPAPSPSANLPSSREPVSVT
jgi:hypothetical protein